MSVDVLVIDDEKDIRTLVADVLADEGFVPRSAGDGNSAIEQIRCKKPDLVILDVWLNDSRFDGIQLLDIIQEQDSCIPVIMISGHGTIETAVKTLHRGAYDFIEKPFSSERLLTAARRALEFSRLKKENAVLRAQRMSIVQIIGTSPCVQQIQQNVEKAAPTNSRIFLIGPPGSGKEAIARMIHEKSTRKEGPFIMYNCSEKDVESISRDLLGEETEDALKVSGRVGLLERANNGTIYFENILDLPLEIQGKLVRCLHDNAFSRVGGKEKIPLNVRIITSSVEGPEPFIRDKIFREDLFYRLAVVKIDVPGLNQRLLDIPDLAIQILNNLCDLYNVARKTFSEEVLMILRHLEWPGNIRQLRNVIEWMVIMHPKGAGNIIKKDHLPPEIRGVRSMDQGKTLCEKQNTPERSQNILAVDEESVYHLPLREARELFERKYLKTQVEKFGGNISKTSSFVGMERSALHRKLKSLNLH